VSKYNPLMGLVPDMLNLIEAEVKHDSKSKSLHDIVESEAIKKEHNEFLQLTECAVESFNMEAHNLEQQSLALSNAHNVIVENKMFRSARNYIDFRALELLEMAKALKDKK
jgi:hypothetical protein